MKIIRAFVVCSFACAAVPAVADVWDVQNDNDNSQMTDNELIHGSMQVHDLGALQPGNVTDEDWYLMGQAPRASYELVVDSVSGDVSDKGLSVVRLSGSLAELQSSLPVTVGLDYARSLRWENTSATPVNDQFIRIRSTNCTSDCGADDIYRVRFYETTFAIPRFNVTTSQVTVLLIQNPTAYAIAGTAYFWNASGGLEHTQPFLIGAHGLYSLSLTSIPILANKSGTITISHTARYGDLAGKAVALEPSTGFSFDSPMIWRPR
jgi:hypothetical protein